MSADSPSPVAAMYERLRALAPGWAVEVGRPMDGGWIRGDDFRDATTGPFSALLERIGARSRTDDRRTIAGSFALHFGWTSAMVIAPYLRFGCVPDCALENIAVRFNRSAYVDATAVYEARGTVAAAHPSASHGSMRVVPDEAALLRTLRDGLAAQGAPVVDALYRWSGFAERASWGVLTSLWATHFIAFWTDHDDQRPLARLLDAFFSGDDVVAEMRPAITPVASGAAVHLHLRRASCCRFYLVPGGGLCASCPLGAA